MRALISSEANDDFCTSLPRKRVVCEFHWYVRVTNKTTKLQVEVTENCSQVHPNNFQYVLQYNNLRSERRLLTFLFKECSTVCQKTLEFQAYSRLKASLSKTDQLNCSYTVHRHSIIDFRFRWASSPILFKWFSCLKPIRLC